MKRYEIIKQIADEAGDSLIACNIGIPSQELHKIKDSPRNFYMLGSMGLISSIGLGLSLGLISSNKKRKVIVIDGDGSILMNLGSLSTISYANPSNLIEVIIDNSAYGSTGNQPTVTSDSVNLKEIAKGAGIRSVFSIKAEETGRTIKKCLEQNGPHVIVIKAQPGNEKVPVIKLSPSLIKNRFMSEVKRGA